MSNPTETTTVDPGTMDRMDRIAAAKVEAEAVKSAKVAHKAKPSTPVLDWMNDPTNATARKASKGTRAPKVNIQYSHDGKAMPASQNKLSSMAYYFTKGIDGDTARVSTERFIELLTKGGASDPRSSNFSVNLSNGITISAVVAGTVASAAPKAAPKAPAAKKATANKKASAKRDVTPQPKKVSRTRKVTVKTPAA